MARGLSTREIETTFSDEEGRSLLSRTGVSELTEKLWEEYDASRSDDYPVAEIMTVDPQTVTDTPIETALSLMHSTACRRLVVFATIVTLLDRVAPQRRS